TLDSLHSAAFARFVGAHSTELQKPVKRIFREFSEIYAPVQQVLFRLENPSLYRGRTTPYFSYGLTGCRQQPLNGSQGHS
ncbi:hypothetical protein, partial [Pseudomonas sp. 5P_5.1_Bac1]|uniref:hypothetical protein n=1 Tax=Pseudomonas sp. 5P_5.1_Bac1 TaxID=2971616 RepID=UPI0021C7E9FB